MNIKSLFSAGYIGDLIALLGGALLPFAFSPFQLHPLALVSPALLLACCLWITPKTALWRGLLYGVGSFGVGISWVYVSIHTYGNTPVALALFVTGVFVFILALFPMVQMYVLTRFWPGTSLRKILLAFPTSWALFEYLRSSIFSGFPWLLLGYSQVTSPLRGYIPVLGEFGLSALMVFCSGLLISAWLYRRKRAVFIVMFGMIYVGGFGLSLHPWTHPQGKPITVSLMQGNIPQELKWEPNYLRQTLASYVALTRQHWDSHLIIWPEAAIPLALNQAEPFIQQLNQEAKQKNVHLITGIPILTEDTQHYYNAAIALGNSHGTYYKRHLVPFGEYLPFKNGLKGIIGFFDLPMSDFIAGPLQQTNLVVAGIPMAIFICYEIAYAEIVRSDLPQAQLLVALTNNAWFGNSLAPWQYLEMGQFRALQTGRYFLSSSNNGISAIINPEGRIEKSVPQFCACVLTGEITAMVGATPWVDIGTLPIIMTLAIVLLASKKWNPCK